MSDLQRTDSVGIFLDNGELVRSCLNVGKFCQKHEQVDYPGWVGLAKWDELSFICVIDFVGSEIFKASFCLIFDLN